MSCNRRKNIQHNDIYTMKYLQTFESFTNTVPKAVAIEQETTLMDKPVDREITEEEKKELMEEETDKKDKKKKKSLFSK
jgi:hypothetical protein